MTRNVPSGPGMVQGYLSSMGRDLSGRVVFKSRVDYVSARTFPHPPKVVGRVSISEK